MPMNLKDIEYIVVLMMENRSFDHLLGYLSLPPYNRSDVEGFKENVNYSNHYGDKVYNTFQMQSQLLEDPPHERDTINTQLGLPLKLGSALPMNGFVESYATRKPAPQDLSLVMGYHTGAQLPIYDFFAKNFTICDHWFSSLPTGTQPNRLMAMSGETTIDVNARFLLPEQKLVYDWLNERNIPWCSYNSGGLPFFSLMHSWQKTILEDLTLPFLDRHRYFREYENFQSDWTNSTDLPSVIFLEPEYTDLLDRSPNDDHPPTELGKGQSFIQSIYETLISNPERWQKTVMLITYDEHGGCYDHVSPLWVKTEPPTPDAYLPFSTTGVRVPAFIVSPFVEPSSVYQEPLDHTAILQFLAERFDPKQSYSQSVNTRQQHFGRLSQALTRALPRTDIPNPPGIISTSNIPPNASQLAPGANANSGAFQTARETMKNEHPALWSEFCTKRNNQ